MTISRAELIAAAQKAFDPQVLYPDAGASWQTIADMGWLAMCVPEERGGLGQGCEARAVIHLALGRALVPGPAIGQMMVIDALASGTRSEAGDALLEAAMAGEVMTASLAIGRAGEWLEAVPDADRASHVLRIESEAIALAPMSACEIRPRETWDTTRRLFDVRIPPAPGFTLAEDAAASDLADAVRANMLLMLAADALGGAEAALAMTVDYLKVRRQFERPLAMFQALKHRCADLRTAISLADALLWQGAATGPTLRQAGALKAQACRVYKQVAEEAIQLHGGIGLTHEHPCHLFLKRAFLNCALGGDADHWEEQTGRALLEELGTA
jgi:alkylation response protein AidB-like acyl-CoA dehydrogenase